jgi:phosphatidate cytidylyltransferase
VVGADPAHRAEGLERGAGRNRESTTRLISALVLMPLAIAAAYLGGWPFAVFWGLAAIGVLWEWSVLVAGADGRPAFAGGAATLAGTGALVSTGRFGMALALIALGGALAAALAPAGRRVWTTAGIGYAGILMVAPNLLRRDPDYGLIALMFLFGVVWMTDILAYFVGRGVGGPKLAPRLSPNKTWSGAIGGAAAGVVAAVATARIAALGHWPVLALIGFGLSVISQAGDLFESTIKRWYGAKDTSHVIPGHGGLMDRLDGFITAVLAAAIIGVLRGGTEAPARGLLVW